VKEGFHGAVSMLLFSEMYCYFCVDLTSGASRGGDLEARLIGVLGLAAMFSYFCRCLIETHIRHEKMLLGFLERSGARLIQVSDENSMFSVAALLLRHFKFAMIGARV